VTAKALGRLDHAAGDPRADPAPAQVTSTAAMVVGLVGVELARAPPAPPAGQADLLALRSLVAGG
jgi:hypothetical protein